MKSVEKWADRIYEETDFGKSIATSASGIAGLIVYLQSNDWVIAAFSTMIVFPIVRLAASTINEKHLIRKKRISSREEAEYVFKKLSESELAVIREYVNIGGTSITWSIINNLPISSSSIESLIQRGVMWPSVTADGTRETFAIDSNLYDVAVKNIQAKMP